MMKFLQKILPLIAGIIISQTLTAQPFCNVSQGDAGFPSNPECETVICDDDPFCCESAWDGQCATSALEFQECQSCLAYCDETYGLAGFEADQDCEDAICGSDPYCCDTNWDAACASAAADEPACSSCGQSFCNESQGGDNPGFQGYPDCETAVCAIDAFCCNTSWDVTCSSIALEQTSCYPCFTEGTPPPPCEINDIANAIPENEDCGDDNNGGCNMTTPSFDHIYCGQTIRGTGWADDGTRDTDWYQFDLDTDGEVSVVVESSFPVFVGIDENFIDCDDGFTIDFSETGDYCSEIVLTATLSEGSHLLFLAPASFEDYPCTGDNTEYNVTFEADLCETIYCNQNLSIAGFPTNTVCQQAVCDGDPFCCESSWDGLCAGDALLLEECTDCIAYCDQPLDIAGFPMDEDCETAICDIDAFCCSTTWDGVCAGAAYLSDACEFCLSPVETVDPCSPFDIPVGATAEMEDCLEINNNGCDMQTPAFGSVSCGETINGTLWAHTGIQDADWYEFELESEAEVTVSGSALMPIQFTIAEFPDSECSAITPVTMASGPQCFPVDVTAVLSPGNYLLVATPDVDEGYQCGSTSNDYYFTLDIAADTPEITADADLDLCPGESVTLTASAGASYEWAPGGETSQSITVSNEGTYSVTVTDGNGCVNTSADVEVTENAEPTATILGGGSVCEGSTADVQIDFTGSAPWSVAITNGIDTETFDNVTENPLTVPIGEPGSWTISAFSDANCDGVGSGSAEILEDCGCEAEPGSLTAVQTPVCLDPVDGTAIVEATVNTAPTVPTGFETLYLLSEGSGLVIIDSDASPTFEVDAAGSYHIHTLIYNPGTYNPNDINFGSTTGNDVADNFVQGGGETCGALDAIGAEIEVEDCNCEADAGTLSPVETPVCLDEVSGTATIGATVETTPVVPDDFEVVYVLTEGTALIIMDTNTDPTFTVDMMGNYTIHTLVYDPATLDLSIIEFGVTSGFDINDLLVQGGGDICGALEVMGAEIEVCDDTGINDRINQQLSVFPNPSKGQFVVKLEGSVGQGSVRVVDISGQQVFQRDVFLNGQFRLDVDLNVAPGTYVLQIITPEGSATHTLEVM